MNFLNQTYPIPTHQSWNVIDTSKLKRFWNECPRAFFFEYLLGWRLDRPSIHTHFGEALHEALEFLLLNGYTIETTEQAYKVFLAKFRTIVSEEEDALYSPKNPSRFLSAITDYVGLYRDDLENFKVLHTEVGGSVAISERFKITFRMDAILESLKTGQIIILDHKSGSLLNQSWCDKYILDEQIGTYLHAANCHFGQNKVREMIINGIFFRKVKDDSKAEKHEFKRVHCVKTSAQMRIWLSTMNRICEHLEHEFQVLSTETSSDPVMKSFPCKTGNCFSYNKKCAYHDLCSYYANPLTLANEAVPLGFKTEFWNPLENLKLKINVGG